MADLDAALDILASRDPWPVRSSRLRELVLASRGDRVALLIGVAEVVAKDAEGRQALGNVLAVLLAECTPGEEVLDARVDAVVGLTPNRKLQERLYARIPAARLAPILVRAFEERPPRDEAIWAHAMISALKAAPEATPAFIAYLTRQRSLARVEPGGDCHAAFVALRAAVPRVDALLGDATQARSSSPRAKTQRAAKRTPSLTIERVRVVASGEEAKALPAKSRAQLLAALRKVTGDTSIKTLHAALAHRRGEAAPLATQYVVREGQTPRYDLWTFFADTGALTEHGTLTAIEVAWIQGAFEATTKEGTAVAAALTAARWLSG